MHTSDTTAFGLWGTFLGALVHLVMVDLYQDLRLALIDLLCPLTDNIIVGSAVESLTGVCCRPTLAVWKFVRLADSNLWGNPLQDQNVSWLV